eukprot:CAMPEP_0180689054 /NCGR_PEP_ID=MMETSP1037_2-20121125/74298_1 /TAXON_ID=632150 /ORGANISM="Azadinium spinosum, Strain 3D9" /LENGTH=172 /DNA_ID=CAMNT_0022719913 /DNA_START=54 /DNA_END=570 /DNA_ORIENTATION=+
MSDLHMVVAALRLMCGDHIVEVWQERICREEDPGPEPATEEAEWQSVQAWGIAPGGSMSREESREAELSEEEAEQRMKEEAERRAREEEEEQEARAAASRLAVLVATLARYADMVAGRTVTERFVPNEEPLSPAPVVASTLGAARDSPTRKALTQNQADLALRCASFAPNSR